MPIRVTTVQVCPSFPQDKLATTADSINAAGKQIVFQLVST